MLTDGAARTLQKEMEPERDDRSGWTKIPSLRIETAIAIGLAAHARDSLSIQEILQGLHHCVPVASNLLL